MRGIVVTGTRRRCDVILWVRTEDKQKKQLRIVGFKPYFYVPDKSGEYISIFGERVRKIYAPDPGRVPEMRVNYEKHYEADIPYTRRFIIDRGIYSGVEFPDNTDVINYTQIRPVNVNITPRLMILDIEVMADVIPTSENPRYPITAWTIYDSYLDTYITCVYKEGLKKQKAKYDKNWIVIKLNKEEDLLYTLSLLIAKLQPDILTGWNIDFDIGYLKARCQTLNIPFKLDGIEIFDMLEAYRITFKQDSYRLKHIAIVEGILKEEEIMNAQEAYQAYLNNDIETFIEYNFHDVYIVKELEDKHKLILGFYHELRKAAGLIHLNDALHNSVLIDVIALRIARENNIVLPSKSEKQKSIPYTGAIVLNPPKGIIENVAVFDMSRYYPSLIISFNLSPETKSSFGEIVVTTPKKKIRFLKEPEGLLPKICKRLLKEREKLEAELKKLTPGTPEYNEMKMKRNVVKYLVNAVYGVMGFEGFRLFDVDVAESITSLGREGILQVKKIAENMGYKVVYGDTDSVMIRVPLKEVNDLLDTLNKKLNQYLVQNYNIQNPHVRLKFEKYYKRMFFKGVKKRYCGWVTWADGKNVDFIEVKGFEAVRRDTPRFIRDVQVKLMELALKGGNRDEIIQYVRNAVKEYKKARLFDIAIPKGISKPLDQYTKNKPPHIRGAILANMYLGTNFQGGSRVRMLWVKYVSGLPKTNVICFDDEEQLRGRKVVVDWNKMLDFFRSKVQDVLSEFGISWEEVMRSERISQWF